MFGQLKLPALKRRFHSGGAGWRTLIKPAFFTSTLIIIALVLASCQSDTENIPTTPPPGNTDTTIYVPPQSSELLKDTRLREGTPTQTQGTINALSVGDEGGTVFDFLIMDSSVVYLDSIPTGSEIVSCTLWVKINRLPTLDNDTIILDLWSIPEAWNENEASWLNRMVSLPWQTIGGGGALIESQLVSLKRLNSIDYVWTVRGQVFGSFIIADAQFLPIPISDSLATTNYNGQSFGFALRVNSATSPNASMRIVSAENTTVENRPYLEWRYR